MIRSTVTCLLLLAALFGGSVRAELPDTIDKVKPSVVGIGLYKELGNPKIKLVGTGFAVGDGSTIVTNYHVIQPVLSATGEELVVLIGAGKDSEVRNARLTETEPAYDLALLNIPGKPLPPMKVSDQTLREGERVAFTGFPIGLVLGLYPATHRGIVSAVTPIVIPAHRAKALSPKMLKRLRDPFNIYQLDATAYPGNSGSPLYDPVTGEVVGIINGVFVKESKESVLENPSGITYAIPSRYLAGLLNQ